VVLGITGGVAVGKSTAARYFEELGAAVVSADQLARQVVAPGSATLQKLADHFGKRILGPDGCLDRQVLGDIVFHDVEARRFLNEITHREVARLAIQRLGKLRAINIPLIIYDSPLLFEAGAEDCVDAVLVITAKRENQLQRLLQRPAMTRARAEAMIDSHLSQKEKAARADFVIDSDGTRDELKEKIRALFQRLTAVKEAPA
jgi:dephospho-CoA kinase